MASFAEETPVSEIVNQVTDKLSNVDVSGTADIVRNPIKLQDQEFVEEFLPPAAILTLTDELITVVIIRTAYARVQLRCIYTSSYPNEPPLIELASPTLPMPLLRNKEKECMDKCRELLGKAQFKAAYEVVYRFIHVNMFVPCWKEMKQVATLCEGKGQLGVDEKEGVLQMRISTGKYRQNIKLKVPYNYPEVGVQIEFVSSNFPNDIQYMFKSQAEDIVRKCEAGFSPDQAISSSNPIKLPPKPTEQKQVKLTTGSLKSLKHDVNVLKQMSDLRAAASAHDSKRYVTQANADRREARKDLRKLVKAESDADCEQQRLLLEEEQNEMKELLKAKISETAQASLFPVAKYLVEEYAVKLPNESCQACKSSILHSDPENEASKNPKSDKRAIRTFCGHWLHWNCLNDWLTSPPFVRQCLHCNRRIWHPDWPEDYKQLEKAWQNKEARKREVSDVSVTHRLHIMVL
jgi:hypothetical protein